MKVTKEQIEQWKKEHGEVFVYETEGLSCYLKTPSRATLGAASMAATNNPMNYNEVIIGECWLGGDEQIKRDNKYFLDLSTLLPELIDIRKGTLKKL